ncbi:GlsB/YeaQ/YmgE family stress response membrane protein [Nocardioides halotolerans]|jgi:uncharacterized membrane protein YeaQ/YmgE (transglycosylase-associated protein family)|uniref:GlsB/YeaQ/YmgE family stress response membrane protein n=1 Tax=Nocardioides halotolerans TaxID=433660 RepID=UPI000424A3CA|nr:hypothetical protein [Nocardioides halotolerans]
MGVGTILWALIGGAIIGLLGKWIAPGDRDIPLWATVLCGVGGVFLGNWIYVEVLDFDSQTRGLDWWRHIWQVGVAALLVIAAARLMGRRQRV